MYNHHLYLLYWAGNAIIIYLLGLVFPAQVSLSSGRLVPVEAAIYAGFWLTFMVWTMWDFVIIKGARLEPPSVAWVYFLLVNLLGVMVVSKFSFYSGLAVAGIGWAAIVALLINVVQRWVWSLILAKR